jgi:hypothetical protein
LIYLPKNGKVYHDYWKNFFATHEPVRPGWYEMEG